MIYAESDVRRVLASRFAVEEGKLLSFEVASDRVWLQQVWAGHLGAFRRAKEAGRVTDSEYWEGTEHSEKVLEALRSVGEGYLLWVDFREGRNVWSFLVDMERRCVVAASKELARYCDLLGEFE